MARDAARTPSALEARARQRASRREQAAAAAAKAGGMLSLAVVLLGSPVAVGHHAGHTTTGTNRGAAHTSAEASTAPDATS